GRARPVSRQVGGSWGVGQRRSRPRARTHALSRRTVAAAVTVLLLSVAVGTERASAGEWSADYRAPLAWTIAKLRQNRARRSWIRPINGATSAYVFREVVFGRRVRPPPRAQVRL